MSVEGSTVGKRRTTTKDVGLLRQLHLDKQLALAPEFQRNSVWPRAAKAYLVDTILNDLPISPLLFQRSSSTQSGRPSYEVIDGQQRLRAVFLYLDNRLRITEPPDSKWAGRKYSELAPDDQQRILDYDFVVEELSGYTTSQVKDIFTRANKYTVSLSSQELRHAKAEGRFAEFVEDIGNWSFWAEHRIFTLGQVSRMRNVEFAAELAILLAEGAQDKKSAIDVWYLAYREDFAIGGELRERLRAINAWITTALPDLAAHRYRKPVDYYALVGAVDQASVQTDKLEELDPEASRTRLLDLEEAVHAVETEMKDPLARRQPQGDRDAARYFLAASRQTDNIRPRQTRIDILASRIV